MGKVSKEFWVSDGFIEQMNNPACELPGLTRSSFEYPIERLNTGDKHSAHKITISYEIDREITVKESDFEKYLQEWDLNTPNIRVTDYLKRKLFGGGENE